MGKLTRYESMKLKKYERRFKEASSKIYKAIEQLSKLPQGKIFDDAKNITGIFKQSKLIHNKVLVDFENMRQTSYITEIPLSNIRITQSNIRENKVIDIIKSYNKNITIPGVRYGEVVVIPDGHHRLTAAFLLGLNKIKVELVDSTD